MPGSFSIEDYWNLSRILSEHPETVRDLRRLVISEEMADIPILVRALLAAQERTDGRLAELAGSVTDLARAQQRTESRLEELAAAQQRTETRLEELARVVRDLAASTEKHFGRAEDRIGALDGKMLEIRYRDHAGAYFGPLLRGLRVVDLSRLDDELDAALDADEIRDLFAADLVVSGTPRHANGASRVMLVVEVSITVDRRDVERAIRRARLLQRVSQQPAIPVVGGEDVTAGGDEAASNEHVLLFQDGRHRYWEPALREWAEISMPPTSAEG